MLKRRFCSERVSVRGGSGERRKSSARCLAPDREGQTLGGAFCHGFKADGLNQPMTPAA